MANPLEDFASGIGPGAFSPQQGSGLPPAAQGGLAFGASSPTPPPAVPGMNFQAAPQQRPGFQLGGPSPDVEAMIRQRLQLLQGPQDRSMAGLMGHDRALDELKGLSSLAGVRSQDRQLQEKNLTELSKIPEEFHTKFSPDQQGSVKDTYAQLIKARAKLANVDLPDDYVDRLLTKRDLSASTAAMFNDSLWKPDQQGIMAELNQTRTADDYEKVIGRWQKKKDAEGEAMVLSALPQAVAALGGSRENPLDMQKFLTNPEIKKHLDGSPTLKRTFNAYVADPKNEKFLANIGLTAGESALKALEGPKMTAEAEQFLGALFTGPAGKPMIPAQAKPEQIQAAIDAAQKYKENALAKQGLRAAELALTMPAPAEERDQHINVAELIKSGQIVKPPQGITVGELRKGEYRFARPEQQKSLMALQPQRTAFADMNAMADRLITANTWQEGIAQGIRLHRTSRTGEDKLAAAYLKSTAAATSYLARMVESGVMTEGDVARWQSAAVASFFDTKGARDIKRALMGDIIDAAQSSVISQVAGVPMKAPTGLREKLDELDKHTRDTWKQTKAGLGQDEMLITDGQGQYAKIKRGSKLTESWKEVK